jgi:drug/metabolite transporter (DMT)-like permease
VNNASPSAVAMMIAAVVVSATAGDLLIASAMRRLGDLGAVRARSGLRGVVLLVVTNLRFSTGVAAMACSFFSLLYALSHAEVSLIAPATSSLTFVTNAVAARFFLNENVDRRRWAAALFVGAGVALLTR